jgi:carboxypeptidase PM20D1
LTWILVALIVLVFFSAFLLANTLRLHRHPDKVEAVELEKVDSHQIARHLADVIQCQTISLPQLTEKDRQPWLKLHEVLKANFPLFHQTLQSQLINQYSLLYTWQGKEPSLAPILFAAHQDVVPVDEDTLAEWKYPPYEGKIADGYVWGRGTLDMKSVLVTLMESAERLIQSGYSPRRSIYFAFGHDEEIYGLQGALEISKWLERKGVRLAALLDEGGLVTEEFIPGLKLPVALVSLGEKGFMTVKIQAQGKPGHSSMPPRQTAVGVVSRALALLDDTPMPARLRYIKPILKGIAYGLPILQQVMLANDWLFGRILIHRLEKEPELNAMLRTTSAATIFQSGVKDNVLPAQAQAKVNFRLLPEEQVEDVLQHIQKVVNDPRVNALLEDGYAWDASLISPADVPAYYTLERVIKQVFSDIPVAHSLMRGASDARHYQKICSHIYRFSPQYELAQDVERVHGVNERIKVEDLGRMVNFYMRLMRVWGDAEF